MSRALWFLAGTASGVYAVAKAKRTARNFTPDGLAARLAAVRAGARAFTDEVISGRDEREAYLLAELRPSTTYLRTLERAPAMPSSSTEGGTNGHR